MLAHLQKPTVARPRPEGWAAIAEVSVDEGGEGGNRSARTVGPNVLLAAAILLSAVLVAVATAALQ
jgi:hypothetical protein